MHLDNFNSQLPSNSKYYLQNEKNDLQILKRKKIKKIIFISLFSISFAYIFLKFIQKRKN